MHALFNRKMNEFLQDLQQTFHNHRQGQSFAECRAWANLSTKIDERTLQRYFARYVAQPYGHLIRARNDAFFLEHDFAKEKLELTLLEDLKSLWSSMTEDNKEAIWNHLNLLVALNDRCEAI
jgi:hypothetical protein